MVLSISELLFLLVVSAISELLFLLVVIGRCSNPPTYLFCHLFLDSI